MDGVQHDCSWLIKWFIENSFHVPLFCQGNDTYDVPTGIRIVQQAIYVVDRNAINDRICNDVDTFQQSSLTYITYIWLKYKTHEVPTGTVYYNKLSNVVLHLCKDG